MQDTTVNASYFLNLNKTVDAASYADDSNQYLKYYGSSMAFCLHLDSSLVFASGLL